MIHPRVHQTRTLWLTSLLHVFTHVYNVALVPLYLQIQTDFHLSNVGFATFLVTLMMLAYCAPGYFMGVLADRFSRRRLLALGLLANAAGFVGLALAPSYPWALVCVTLAGLGGSIFHPAANALIGETFPTNVGRAMGFLGIGASVGFFISPLYVGWRAAHTGQWRTPILELGLLGLVGSGLFAWLAEEPPALVPPLANSDSPSPTPHTAQAAGTPRARPSGLPLLSGEGRGEGNTTNLASRPALFTTAAHPAGLEPKPPRVPIFPTRGLWFFFIAASLAFGLRDFAGASMSTLGSLFLQKAHGFSLQATGVALSGIFIASALSNPLFGHLSDRGRGRWGALVLLIAASLVAFFPHASVPWLIPTFLVYGFFQMASYPIVEAALMEAVPNAVRGRVMGFWITVGGVVGNLAHWIMGQKVQDFAAQARHPQTYFGLYGVLGLLMLLSLLGFPCLHAIRKRDP